MNITLSGKIYTIQSIKAKMLRKAVSLTSTIDFEKLTVDDLDKMVAFVCECFDNQFTVDDVYDGLPANELIPNIMKVIQFINGELKND